MEKANWRLLAQIFISFLKIGPVTFGGGYAMIPLIEREVVENRKWVKTKDIADIFAVSESVPGAIAINSATFVGYRLAGVLGAVSAMLGVLLPTFFLMILISIFYLLVRGNPYVEAFFVAIRASVVALIVYAAVKIGKTALLDFTTAGLIVFTVILLLFVPIHPLFIIIGGGIAGIVIVQIRKTLGLKTKLEQHEETEELVEVDVYIDGEARKSEGF